MATLNPSNSTTTGLNSAVSNFSVSAKIIDESNNTDETYWYNPDWSKNLGYYKQIPELKKAIDAIAMWSTGKGWTADIATTDVLSKITGWGEDSFDSIMQNMIIVKKVNGDSFAEVIRDDEGELANLKPLNPSSVRIVLNPKGVIKRYDVFDGSEWKPYAKNKILHLCNDRIANEMHGISVIEACKWVIDARNEAMADKRRILHRSTIRIMEVDSDDSTTINRLKTEYANAIKNGEVLIVPKDNVGFPNVNPLSTAEHSDWIRYLENFFYQAVGVPKIILGGSQEFTEASSKIGYLTFEQPYMTEQRLLEQDIWNQLFIKVTFNRPVSLKEAVQTSEEANTGQVGFQENDMITQVGRNE